MTTHTRECGDCTLCCTVVCAPELHKPEGVRCDFCQEGCTIHDERPQMCRDFFCGWVRGDMGEHMRPDKSHIVIEYLPGVPVALALVESGYEHMPGRYEKDLLFYVDKKMSLMASCNRMVMLPPGVDQKTMLNDVKKAAKSMGVL